MNKSAKGNAADVRTTKLLEADGWTVGSRRHIPGPGDLLAVRFDAGDYPLGRLIEVKARKDLWQGFRREDRRELAEYAADHGLIAEVCWWAPRAPLPQFLAVDAWPSSR